MKRYIIILSNDTYKIVEGHTFEQALVTQYGTDEELLHQDEFAAVIYAKSSEWTATDMIRFYNRMAGYEIEAAHEISCSIYPE